MAALPRRWALGIAAVWVLANGLVLAGSGLPVTVGVLVLGIALPGLLLVAWLLHTARPHGIELALYGLGTGYALLTLLMLALAARPGGLTAGQVAAALDVVILVLASMVVRRYQVTPPVAQPDPVAPADRATWVSLLIVLALAAALRLPNLGYSDFQGDEARAMLRAAETIQGYESSLLIHKKGPVEILLPTAVYAVQGDITETQARLPFALANLAGVAAIFVLGRRLFGLAGGTVAGLLLAVDGYLIGFSRIVQYQSVVFLTVTLVVLLLVRQIDAGRPSVRDMGLAGLLFATGLLAHYEALWVLIPGVYLLWMLARRSSWTALGRALALPAVVTTAILAAFYVPFVLDARFARTADDLLGNRIGSRFPYNNLADFFDRTAIYNSVYYVLLLIAAAVVGQAVALRRSWSRGVIAAITGVTVVGLALCFFVDPGWLRAQGWEPSGYGGDQTWLLFALAVGVVLVAPRTTLAERTVWLWFGVPMMLSLFFVAKPNSHVYGFFMGWALVVGAVAEAGWQWLAARLGEAQARWVSLPVTAVLTLVFAVYGYWFFTRTDVESLREWTTQHLSGYWTPYTLPDRHSLFGFPYRNGGKVIGALYADGTLTAPFDTNETDRVADWYTRGVGYCPPDAEVYVVAPPLLQSSQDETNALVAELTGRGFAEYGQVTVNGSPRLLLYTSLPVTEPSRVFDAADYAPVFDALTDPHFAKNGPVVGLDPAVATDYRLGDAIRLVGYTVADEPVAPGDALHISLFWQRAAGSDPIDQEYKVFTQVIDLGDLHKVAQRDSEPACTEFDTDEWRPGETVLDRYTLTVAPDARPGDYTLLVGMYDGAEQRLSVRAQGAPADGASLGDAMPLTTIRVAAP